MTIADIGVGFRFKADEALAKLYPKPEEWVVTRDTKAVTHIADKTIDNYAGDYCWASPVGYETLIDVMVCKFNILESLK